MRTFEINKGNRGIPVWVLPHCCLGTN